MATKRTKRTRFVPQVILSSAAVIQVIPAIALMNCGGKTNGTSGPPYPPGSVTAAFVDSGPGDYGVTAQAYDSGGPSFPDVAAAFGDGGWPSVAAAFDASSQGVAAAFDGGWPSVAAAFDGGWPTVGASFEDSGPGSTGEGGNDSGEG